GGRRSMTGARPAWRFRGGAGPSFHTPLGEIASPPLGALKLGGDPLGSKARMRQREPDDPLLDNHRRLVRASPAGGAPGAEGDGHNVPQRASVRALWVASVGFPPLRGLGETFGETPGGSAPRPRLRSQLAG